MYACICMYVYVCMYMYACICVCVYVCVYVCMYVYVCVYAYMRMYVCITYWGNCPGGKCPTQNGRGIVRGVIVRGNCPGGIVQGELSYTPMQYIHRNSSDSDSSSVQSSSYHPSFISRRLFPILAFLIPMHASSSSSSSCP